jgi:hypothetical protein
MSQLPAPIRAALGLVATVVQDRRGLSDKVLELPVLAVSTALQVSLRAQQRYAELTVRGDELLTQWQGGAPEEPPAWARFDDDTDSDTDGEDTTADRTVPADEPAAPPAPTTSTPPVSPAKAAKAAKAMAKVAAAAEAAHDAQVTPGATANPPVKPPVKRAAKKVTAPRNGKASAFDRINDSEPPEQPTD